MITDNAIRAEILTQAVPYIKEYTGKYVVAKYGGNAMTDPVLKKNVMQDILLLHLIGVNVILVRIFQFFQCHTFSPAFQHTKSTQHWNYIIEGLRCQRFFILFFLVFMGNFFTTFPCVS